MVVAVTASENVKVCPAILVIVPKLFVVPTAPVNVTLPEPDPKVKSLSVVSIALTVLENRIAFDVVVSVVIAPSVAASL